MCIKLKISYHIARDKVCHLPARGRWISPGISASSTSKADDRDIKIVEIGGD